MSRGKVEEAFLHPKTREERAHLPVGIGLENSPLYDLSYSP